MKNKQQDIVLECTLYLFSRKVCTLQYPGTSNIHILRYSQIKMASRHRLNMYKSAKAQVYEVCSLISVNGTLKQTEVAIKPSTLKAHNMLKSEDLRYISLTLSATECQMWKGVQTSSCLNLCVKGFNQGLTHQRPFY